MSLVTQCPQCALLFRMPAEQLAAAKGQVRCGQCAHEFEGLAFAITPPGPEPVLTPEAHPKSLAELPTDSLLSSSRIDVEALLRRKDVPAEPLPAACAAPLALAPMPPPAPMQQSESSPAPTLPLKPDWRIESAAVGAARRTVWVLRSVALLLAVGLCMQALMFFKDEIAARWPASRPVLEALCQPAVCTVAPLRRWNGIVIDSSSLVRSDLAYVLNLSLRNSLEMPLAMTAIELTLTDEQDRALTCRVLSPSDLGAPSVLAAGQVWQRSLSVEPLSLQAEIAGYRLVSFYP